jgi:uncharacterized membrane-anchored protein YhcB (DUF1043 family)
MDPAGLVISVASVIVAIVAIIVGMVVSYRLAKRQENFQSELSAKQLEWQKGFEERQEELERERKRKQDFLDTAENLSNLLIKWHDEEMKLVKSSRLYEKARTFDGKWTPLSRQGIRQK